MFYTIVLIHIIVYNRLEAYGSLLIAVSLYQFLDINNRL